MKDYYFYMWRHPYTGMTCFGITNHHVRRLAEYEGHNGFDIEWSYLISGNEPTIKELEKSIKRYLQKLKIGYKGYEWIVADVDYETVVQTVEYLVDGKKVEKLIGG